MVAFVFFNSFFHDPSSRLFCDTLFDCFITVVRLGALAEPPLGDVSIEYDEYNRISYS